MIETRPLNGVIPVVQTPINADGSIDEESLRRHVDFLCGLDTGGFWGLGTGGEDMNLTFEKRLQVARVLTEANAGRKPLILGAGFYALEEIFEFMDAVEDLEFDAYHVMPYHPLLSLDRLDWFYRQIADRAPKPLWLYYSSNWSRRVTPAFVGNLRDHPNIAGVKYSIKDTVEQLKVIAFDDPGFQVITAIVGQFFAVLSMGVRASTTSMAGALPEPLIEIYDLFRAGKHEEARQAQLRFNAFCDALPKTLKADNFLGAAEEKYMLSLRGLMKPYTTSYYRDANEAEQAQIRKALEDFHMLPEDVPARAAASMA